MEAWNPQEKPNLSWSHPWATAPATAIARGFFGISPTTAGYESLHIQPQVCTMYVLMTAVVSRLITERYMHW